MLTKNKIIEVLREFGIKPGDSLIVHSSFRSLGEVEGGPGTVVEALLEAIGPPGNLMLPTFNYTRPLPDPYYDPNETSCRTGIIPETARKFPGAVRSLHPTHSVAVIGPDAEELTKDHLSFPTFGKGSPIDRLARRGGKVLLIGVGNITNSMIHVAEEYAGTPKVSWYDPLPVIKVLMPDGTVIEHQLDTSPSCSSAFGAMDYPLRRRELLRDAKLNSSKLQLMRGKDVIDCAVEIIQEKPDVLLCASPACVPCTGARRNLKNMGLI
jgi:aminoglycoside 3-N-acetyltransferase